MQPMSPVSSHICYIELAFVALSYGLQMRQQIKELMQTPDQIPVGTETCPEIQ